MHMGSSIIYISITGLSLLYRERVHTEIQDRGNKRQERERTEEKRKRREGGRE